MASSKQLAVSLLLLGCFGCEYTAEAERPETRVMQNLGGCPEEDAVADEAVNGVDADRTAWRRVDQSPLCYYRVHENEKSRVRRCSTPTTDGLDEVHARAEERFKMNETGVPAATGGDIDCTAEGMLLVVPADGPTCAEDAPDKAGWERAGVDVGELIASDHRQPVRICNYDVTYEYTRRPFSCGGARMGFAP